MKKFYLCLALCLSVLSSFCNEAKKYENKGYNATTMELIQMVENNSELKNLLTQAIEKGKAINPDTTTNPVQSLDDYYEFIDFSQKVMPWNVILCPGQPTIFGRMYQALCYCYFINCMPLEALEDHNFFTSSVQYVEPYRTWLVKYCQSWGKYLSSSESWNK